MHVILFVGAMHKILAVYFAFFLLSIESRFCNYGTTSGNMKTFEFEFDILPSHDPRLGPYLYV